MEERNKKLRTAGIALLLLVLSITVFAGDERCFNSMGSHCFTDLEGEELIVLFDTVLSAFDYQSVCDDIESLGLLRYLQFDTTLNGMVFMPLSRFSDSALIDSVYSKERVDTIYYPVVSEEAVFYYDIRKFTVKFGNNITAGTITDIIDSSGCSIFRENPSNSYILNLNDSCELFDALNNFSKLDEVDYVDLVYLGYGGRLDSYCAQTTNYLSWDACFAYIESSNLILNIDYSFTSSPCSKVNDLILMGDSEIKYYGIYTAGDGDSPCQETDVVVIEGGWNYNSVNINFFDQLNRCYYEFDVFSVEVTSESGISNEENVTELEYNLHNNLLTLNTVQNDNIIHLITVNNLLGQTLLVNKTGSAEGNVTIDLSELKNGIYIISVVYKNGRSEVLKIMKN